MARTLDEVEDESERKVITDIAEYGWHVLKILEDDEGPAFAFTIGLGTTFGHPELLMVGQRHELMHIVLNNLGHRIRNGRRFAHGDRSGDVLGGFTCEFVEVNKDHYRDWLGFARWYYRGNDFETLQVVWPDKSNHLPWDEGVVAGMTEWQPILGSRREHDA